MVTYAVPKGSLPFWAAHLAHTRRELEGGLESGSVPSSSARVTRGTDLRADGGRRPAAAVDHVCRSAPTWRRAGFTPPCCRCVRWRRPSSSSSTPLASARSAWTATYHRLGAARRRPGQRHRPAPRARSRRPAAGAFGEGTFHHIAFGVENDEQLIAARRRCTRSWATPTRPKLKDRYYFHSMYVRAPGGILVECTANVAEGFYIDETPDELGTHLNLPPWYEDQRSTIVSMLEDVVLPEANRPRPARQPDRAARGPSCRRRAAVPDQREVRRRRARPHGRPRGRRAGPVTSRLRAQRRMTAFAGQFDLPRLDRVDLGPRRPRAAVGESSIASARRRVVVVTGRTLGASALLDRVTAPIGDRCVAVFTGSRQHVPASSVAELVALMRAAAGGRPGQLRRRQPDRHRQAGRARGGLGAPASGIPHIAIPTTLSAGEFTSVAGITDDDTRIKRAVHDARLAPRVVIADPAVTLDTPAWLWAASGVRALDHAVESMYSNRHHPMSDATAARGSVAPARAPAARRRRTRRASWTTGRSASWRHGWRSSA